jgi:hypothetical protein
MIFIKKCNIDFYTIAENKKCRILISGIFFYASCDHGGFVLSETLGFFTTGFESDHQSSVNRQESFPERACILL